MVARRRPLLFVERHVQMQAVVPCQYLVVWERVQA